MCLDNLRGPIQYTQDEMIKEQLWETEMIRRGRDAYLESLDVDNLTDSDVGRSLSMSMIPRVSKEIRRKQEEMTDVLLGSNSRAKTGAAHLLPLCDPDLLAVAAVQHYLRAMLHIDESGEISVRRLLDYMEDAYIEAMGLQVWESSDGNDYSYFWKNNADKLSTLGSTARSRNAFKKRLKERLERYYTDFKDQHDSTQAMQLSVATELLSCVGFTKVKVVDKETAYRTIEEHGMDSVVVADDSYCIVEESVGPFSHMFILKYGWEKGRTTRKMYLSEKTAETIDYSIEKKAVGNTSMRPMLVKPSRWLLATS